MSDVIGYIAPDGTHHACEAWEHRLLARKITGIEPRTFESIDEGTPRRDAEEELDKLGYVRIERLDRNDPDALSWGARWYDRTATLTDAQKRWLVLHGYGRALRELLALHTTEAHTLVEPEAL